jgi:GNAT superfamily N-acetyltransferase
MKYRRVRYKIEKLNLSHADLDFDCNDEEINEYWRNQIFIDAETNNNKVYVFLTGNKIIGLYALAMKSPRIEIEEIELQHPVALIGVLAVNSEFQGQGWGSLIVKKAIKKAELISKDIGCIGVIVETYSEDLIGGFYKELGFECIKREMIREKGSRFTLFHHFSY